MRIILNSEFRISNEFRIFKFEALKIQTLEFQSKFKNRNLKLHPNDRGIIL